MINFLIVDDDKMSLVTLKKILKNNLNRIFLASNGADALKVIESEDIDIVLLDVKLTDMSGLELLVELKKRQSVCEVIVITGCGNQELAIQSLRYGAIDYIEKPIVLEDLFASLGRAREKLAERKKLSYDTTVLVIDDDANVTDYLIKILEKEGYSVFSANSGEEGIEILKQNKIDLFLTDIKMRDINGIEVLRKARLLYEDIEGIMMTGYNDQELAIQALRVGAFDYLVKPVNLELMLHSIKKAIEKITLYRNSLYRNRELKITSQIISKTNEELEKRIEERSNEINQIQAQLFQTSKLATLGEMSAGLAHEMNQPLGGIALTTKNLSRLLVRDMLTKEEIEEGINDIEYCIQRMTKIIQHIRIFSRQDTLKFMAVDINQTINSALGLLGEQLRLHAIDVELDLQEDLPKISGEPYQLEQVWINLITNARDAVDEKEEKIRKKEMSILNYSKKIKIITNQNRTLKTVEVQFTDNGIGMQKDVMKKALEPFFTTKEVGQATGLGLSISYGIIQTHKGSIEIFSKVGEETTIKVSLNAS